MFIDTSAIIETLISGPQAANLVAKLRNTTTPRTTIPTVIYEATVVLANKRNVAVVEAEEVVRDFLSDFNISVVPISDQTASHAIDAFARYGKGRHPAKLNFGDCFSYAGAKSVALPLLYVGNDFALTDLA
jgi:ribonuclease VapC